MKDDIQILYRGLDGKTHVIFIAVQRHVSDLEKIISEREGTFRDNYLITLINQNTPFKIVMANIGKIV